MTNREQMAAGLMIAMGMVLIWWVNAPGPVDPPVPPSPIDPAEEALAAIAASRGEHLVRCPLPPNTPQGVRLNLRNPVQADGSISGLSSEADGETLIFPPPPGGELLQADPAAWGAALRASGVALGRLRWTGASSSSGGTCVLEEAPAVEVVGPTDPDPPADEAPYATRIAQMEGQLAAARETVREIEASEDAFSVAINAGVSAEAATQLHAWRASDLSETQEQIEALQSQIPWWRLQQKNELRK